LNPLSALYARIARARRDAYAARPDRRRRLSRPVVSVGNLSLGGSGKTPVVEHLARLLLEAGHRPAILSRGYGRAEVADGAVVVSDGGRLCADLARAGDEPLMLARNLPGAVVIVCADRHLGGRLAERHLGCDVHLLDDGFQHVALERDVDLLIVTAEDLARPHVVPAGRLRESLDAARHADAVLWSGDDRDAQEVAAALGVEIGFAVRRLPGALDARPFGHDQPPAGARVVAVAAIARPRPFVAELGEAGYEVVRELTWPDHHRFVRADIERMTAAVRASGAAGIVMTEKDMVRLLPWRPLPVAAAWRRLEVHVEPARAFREWLLGRLVGPGRVCTSPVEPAA
jgi:tetraacyldisaccharide 4'-kinase